MTMKMSDAMQLCGYGALPGGAELIRSEREKEAAKPKFTLVEDYDKLRPFDCINGDDEHFGAYVIRDDKDLEVIVEVNGWTEDDPCELGGPIFGNTWTVDGHSVNLTPEESERIAEDWRYAMEARAEKEELLRGGILSL